jgi:vacuolar-type H+-ATPase subunit E/Vma4
MSAEAIIKKIQTDADKEIKQIQKNTKGKIDGILEEHRKKTKELEQDITEKGKKEIENMQKIRISQANQEVKRQIMNVKEELIETCFEKATDDLKRLDNEKYRTFIQTLIDEGKKQIKGSFTIKTSRPIDKKIAEEKNISISGTVQASGGIILISEKGNLIIDNTFEGILTRRKQEIRVQVGKLLFPY